jgi:hypothetical protein
VVRKDEPAAPREEHAQPVPVDVEGAAQAQLVVAEVLAAVGIDHDILGGGEEGDEKGGQSHQPGRLAGIGQAECRQGEDQQKLNDQHPAAPAPEKRQGEAVKDRRPEEFERIGQAHQGVEADDREIDLLLGHPGLEHGRGEQQRHTAGKPHEEGHQYAWGEKLTSKIVIHRYTRE